jgi:hypothetical protein
MKRQALLLLLATLPVAACDDPAPQREAPLTSTSDCRLQHAAGVVPVGRSDTLVAFASCIEATRCRAGGPLMAESFVNLAIDVEQAQVPSHDYRYTAPDAEVVTLTGSTQVMRDGCSQHVLTQQGILTQQAGSTTLRLHEADALAPDRALGELTLEVARPHRALLSSAGETDVERLALRVGERARIESTVQDAGGSELTTLGQELWWVDDPALLSLAPVPFEPDTEPDTETDNRPDAEPAEPDAGTAAMAPPLQIRGVAIDVQARTAGTTRLHVLALNLEHSIEVVVEP